jgi:hypothetical protein
MVVSSDSIKNATATSQGRICLLDDEGSGGLAVVATESIGLAGLIYER